MTQYIEFLQQLLVLNYITVKAYPKSKYWKGEYKNVLNELDKEMQLLPLPFSND